jgi:hypothetical protein
MLVACRPLNVAVPVCQQLGDLPMTKLYYSSSSAMLDIRLIGID